MTIIFDGTQGITTPAETANNSVTTPVVKSGSALTLQTNGSTTAVTIDTSQKVGIGTANTLGNSLLNVAEGIVARNSGGTSPYFQLYNGTAGTDLKTWRIGGSPQGNLIIDTVNDAYSVGTERMRIDSSGRVTMPYQPAFHAVRTGGNVSSTGIFICDTVTYNDGNHYNSSTGRFTAPVAGRYQLNFFVLSQNANSFDFHIRVNGSQYPGMDIRCNNGTGGNFTLSCSAIFKLSAGDIVDPFIAYYASGPVYGLGLNAFSMYLLG